MVATKSIKQKLIRLLNKNFVRVCFYIIPVILFFAMFDFTKTSSLFTEKTGINYTASYCLYIVVIELARKLHADTDDSERARHIFNQSFVYFPLALFLCTASYALYSAGTEAFGVISEKKSQIQVDEKVKEYLTAYQLKCENDAAAIDQHKCIEKFLSGNLFAEVELMQKQYEDTSNSYSIIAIMTGFFGVLMTVLVIYFSLSGRELLEHKLTEANDLIKRQQKIVGEIEKFQKDVLTSTETTNQRLSNVEEQIKIKGSEDKDKDKGSIINTNPDQFIGKLLSTSDNGIKNNAPDDNNKYKKENQTNSFCISDEIKTIPHIELDPKYSFRFKLFISTDGTNESDPIIDELIISPFKLNVEKWKDAVNKGAQLLVIEQINDQGIAEKTYGPFIYRA